MEPLACGHAEGVYARGGCKVCVRARVKAYADANREKVRAANRLAVKKHSLLNPERRKASKAKWSEANRELEREIVRASSRKWYWKNRDRALSANRRWIKENLPSVRARNARREAQQARAMPPWAEKEKIALVYRKAQEFGFEVDHVVPLQNPNVCGLHVWANLQLLTKSDNSAKGNRVWPDMP